tara:strand:- start:156 stop:563 length:408 start_codon:yes stop_codon:yes gene_type:complete
MENLIKLISKDRGVERRENVVIDEVYIGNEIIERLAEGEGNGETCLKEGIFCGPDFWERVIEPMYGNCWYWRDNTGCVEGGNKYPNPVIVLSQGGGIDVGEPHWAKIFIYYYKGKLRATHHVSDGHGFEYLTKLI